MINSVAALVVTVVGAFLRSNYYGLDNTPVVTASMLRPSELSEEELMQTWGVMNDNTAQVVDRVPMSEMTHDKFRQEYLLPRRPVVVEGAYASSPLTMEKNGKWSLPRIREAYGNVQLPSVMIPPQKGDNINCSYAGLCKKEGQTTLGEFFDQTFLLPVDERRRKIRRGYQEAYPHDLNLQYLLPDMFAVYRKLSLFAENIRLATVRGQDKWPSLFFGAAGTRTGLHVDMMGTSFTMAVFQGRKQFGEWQFLVYGLHRIGCMLLLLTLRQ
jgi:hypothetical protein